MQYQIRPYEASDRAACLRIFRSNQPTYFTPEELGLFTTWLDEKTDENYWVIQIEGQVIGCGGIFWDDRVPGAGLSWGMVHQDLHGQGWGKIFTIERLKRIQQTYPNQPCHIDTSQHTAAFYEKLGFSTHEIIPEGFGPGLDQYKMTWYNFPPTLTHPTA
ncbi:MAG: GNAT family N-acetyltransferase [Bacteroidota bacterium]